MFSDVKIRWLNTLRSPWPAALIVVIAAAVAGAIFFRSLHNRIVARNLAAYNKTHGTYIQLNGLTDGENGSYGDYCSADRRKLVAIEEEELAILAIIDIAARREAFAYIVIFVVMVLIIYIASIHLKTKGA